MNGATRDLAEPVELVRSDLRGIWLLFVPAPIGIAGVLLAGLDATTTVLFVLGFGGIFLLPIVALRWSAGRNAIFADPMGLIAVVRGRAHRAPDWDEVHDASWFGGTLWLGWDPGGIVVTTAAGDVRVGSIVIVRPRRRAEAGEHVITYLRARLGRERVAE